MTPETFARLSPEARALAGNAIAGPLRSPEPLTPAELRAWRKRLGLSQTALAARIGTTQNTVSRWEIGIHPIPRWLPRLMDAITPKVA